DNDPELAGTAEAGSTVRVYTTNDCSGAAAATGTAAAFGGSGLTISVANDSSSTFTATATDAAGNGSACSTGVAYVEDSSAPAAPNSLATSPASPANDNDPEVSGTAEAGTTVRLYTTNDCSGAPLATGSAATFNGAGVTASVADDSTSTFKATATDAAGNASACSTGVAYVEDSTAPATPSALDSSPASPANENDPEITGSADAGSTVRLYTTSDCSGAPLATGAAASFAAPGLSVNVADDSTTSFRATARDSAGNTSACSPALTYVEDSAVPSAPSSLATSPASPANDNDPEISGSAEAGTTVRVYTTNDCSGAPTASGSAATFGGAGLSVTVANDSTTTFKATATDGAGNTSACSTGISYAEDSIDPTSAITFPVAATTYTTATWADFAGTASDAAGSGLQRVELSIRRDSDGQYWNGSSFSAGSEDWRTATATASWAYAFAVSNFPADGDYTVRVRAVDNAGNAEAASARTFTVDRGAPNTTVDSGPNDPSNDPNPGFVFSANEGSVTFQCQIDGGGWGACTSPKSYTGLTEASHTFEVRATDGAGNTDPTPASQTWTIDLTDPASAFTFPAAGGSYNTAGWSDIGGTASDTGGSGLLHVEVSVRRVSTGNYWDGGAFDGGAEQWHTASGTGTWSLAFAASSFPSDGDYAVRVRAVDDAGNTQTPVSRSFTVDT
ncbi:MAG TPA: Ig-like domain-containing protein, partial [Gaiellaceae bacterium]|nr:Ig-like domain-containing protein [Gaiellaceae bacterium]